MEVESMTGRDLIIYIIENDLLDEPIFEGGKFIGTMTAGEFAAEYNVGISTVKAWSQIGKIESYDIPEGLLIPIKQLNKI